MSETDPRKNRRKAAACAASCAALAGLPAVTFSHGHPVIGFLCMAAQLVLLILAIRFFSRSQSRANRA